MCFSTAAVLSSAAYLPMKYLKLKLSGSLFSVFWLNSHEECQLSLHVHNT